MERCPMRARSSLNTFFGFFTDMPASWQALQKSPSSSGPPPGASASFQQCMMLPDLLIICSLKLSNNLAQSGSKSTYDAPCWSMQPLACTESMSSSHSSFTLPSKVHSCITMQNFPKETWFVSEGSRAPHHAAAVDPYVFLRAARICWISGMPCRSVVSWGPLSFSPNFFLWRRTSVGSFGLMWATSPRCRFREQFGSRSQMLIRTRPGMG
mmetsp:Transcript_55525/g.149736  ORF Transcript_55525/g.149736 Transcript_55525/m.149736 type:complete len:211 (-) Transcript_55525:1963-2595(-)